MMYLRHWTGRGLLVTTIASSLMLTGCFSSSSSSDDEEVVEETETEETVAGQFKASKISFDSTEESNPSVGFFTADDGELGIRVSGVENNGDIVKPELENLEVEEGDVTSSGMVPLSVSATATALSCSDIPTGSAGLGDRYDVGISLDTTGSMGGAAGVFADEIVDFANELTDLDVRFAGITVGDAYATKRGDDMSAFTDSISRGTLGEPPSFDSTERPDTGTRLLNASALQTFFSEVSDWVGSGRAGGDGPENFLGSIDFLHEQVRWREDAGRVIISIGDNSSHTSESADNGQLNGTTLEPDSPWYPPEPAEFEEQLATDGVSVNLIWNPTGLSASAPYYNMENLAKATGGSITEFSSCTSASTCDVELTELPAIRAITSERTTKACSLTTEADEFTVRFDINVADSRFWKVEALINRAALD